MSEDTGDLFADLEPAVREKLGRILHARTFPAGAAIFAQGAEGAAMYLIRSGRIKITRVTPEGEESVLCVRGPGEYFCPVPVLDGGAQLGTAIAMTEVKLLWAEREAFCGLCGESARLLARVQGDCLAEVRSLLGRLEASHFRTVRQRLAAALLEHCQESSASELRLTQQELAGLVGASRERVSRSLAQMEREGLLELKRGRVILRDRKRLQTLAGRPPPPRRRSGGG